MLADRAHIHVIQRRHHPLRQPDVLILIAHFKAGVALSGGGNLMITADILSYILVSYQIPQNLAASILTVSTNQIIVQMFMILILLVVGTFLNNSAAMVLLAPIFYPILISLNIDPLFFGIIMVISLAIGHNTPPVGLCLFVACDIGGVKLERLVKEVAPLVLVMILAVFVMNCFPQLILFLRICCADSKKTVIYRN